MGIEVGEGEDISPEMQEQMERFRDLHTRWGLALMVARLVGVGRMSFQEFADLAGVTEADVIHYYHVWDSAADYGLVPRPAELSPGQHVDLSGLSRTAFEKYLTGKGDGKSSSRRTGGKRRKAPVVKPRAEFCACGCMELLPSGPTARRQYIDDTHRQRAQRARDSGAI